MSSCLFTDGVLKVTRHIFIKPTRLYITGGGALLPPEAAGQKTLEGWWVFLPPTTTKGDKELKLILYLKTNLDTKNLEIYFKLYFFSVLQEERLKDED